MTVIMMVWSYDKYIFSGDVGDDDENNDDLSMLILKMITMIWSCDNDNMIIEWWLCRLWTRDSVG